MTEPHVRTYRVVQASVGGEFTGERFMPGVKGAIEVEHLHRYLFALQFCAGKAVLDIACGEGYGAKLISAVAGSVVGVDIDKASIKRAERAYGADNVRFLQGSATAIPLGDASVDVAVSFETIEHLAEQDEFLGELARVLRPGGLLVMSSPDRYVYDRVNAGPNEFHVKELSIAEFEALLRSRFSNIALGLQKIEVGSVILPRSGAAARAGAEQFKRTEGAVERSADLLEAPYVVAVASNKKLPPVLWSTYEDLAILEGMQREHAAAVQALELRQAAQLADAERRWTQQLADIERARAEQLAEVEQARAEQLAERLAESSFSADQRVAAALAEAQRTSAEVLAELSRDRDAAVEALNRDFQAQLGAAHAHIQHLEHERSADRQRLEQVQAELERRQRLFGPKTQAFLHWLARRPSAPYRELKRWLRRMRGQSRAAAPASQPAAASEPWLAPVSPGAPNPADDQADYAALSQRLADARRQRIETLSLTAPPMIRCPPDRSAFAAGLALPPPPTEPDVSIIIPVYNGAAYVLECLAAIAKQPQGASFEVIVIDDASEAETRDLLDRVPNIRLLRNEANLGFLRTCNRALEAANGRYTVFLNSDAQVQPGWLDALLSPFDEEQNVGAVGPKLIYPEGRLQEAGGLINRDATATLVGLFDDPALPRYNRRREVEYCSGACLVVKTEVMRELGGFDLAFAPAYCEDSDLCFRLRARGLRIFYEPTAVVVHHLSVSSDTLSKTYKRDLAIRNQQTLSERWGAEIDKLNDVKVIALYLPQFHPIAENDRWWGKGFTEWTNVAKATPNFVGHNQPNIPQDLGFYDLRLAEVLEAQAALARRYGIHGFCFYYYWFGGRRLLEQPLEHILQGNKPDFPFCIAWANENWTKHWDGQDREILVAQNHSAEDDVAVIADMSRYLRHPNYIRIDGRPLLIVYRPTRLPDPRATAELWRSECRRNGVGEIYLALIDSFNQIADFRHPRDIGFDGVIEFPPHNVTEQMDPPGAVVNPRFEGVVQDYQRVAARFAGRDLPGYPFFRTVMPRWDNTPRQQDRPHIFSGATPGAYQAWLDSALQDTRETAFGDERMVFVNAWNEWAEGAYLEPDRVFGHRYLEATKNSLDRWLKARGA